MTNNNFYLPLIAFLGICSSIFTQEQDSILRMDLKQQIGCHKPGMALTTLAGIRYAQDFQNYKDKALNNKLVSIEAIKEARSNQEQLAYLTNKCRQNLNACKKQLCLTDPSFEYTKKFQAQILTKLDTKLDQIIDSLPKELCNSQQDPSKEQTIFGSFIDMGYSEEQALKDVLNDYTGLRIITQNRTLGITSFGATNTKINTINKVINLKKRNNDDSYRKDVQTMIELKKETFSDIQRLAKEMGIYSPHIPEHRNLLDYASKQSNQQFYAAFKAQHEKLSQLVPEDAKILEEYNDLSNEFKKDYALYVAQNAPLQPLTEAMVYNLEKPTAVKETFVQQYSNAFKTKTPMLVKCINQKLDEVKEVNIDVRGFTPAHSYILSYVAQHQQKPNSNQNDTQNQAYFAAAINYAKSWFN